MGNWYRDPTYEKACALEAERRKLIDWAHGCRYRKPPIFYNDTERCSSKTQAHAKCDFCNLKKGVAR